MRLNNLTIEPDSKTFRRTLGDLSRPGVNHYECPAFWPKEVDSRSCASDKWCFGGRLTKTSGMQDIRFDTAQREGDTIGDFAYRRIRLHIVNGQLAPDEKLKLDHLKQVYGASVTTLREILNRLAVEELVTAEGQRGFRVAPVSDAELSDLADLRTLLETHALRQSIRLGDLDWEASVVAAHYKLSVLEAKLMEDRTAAVEDWVACDWGFHNATIAACRQPVLMCTYASVFDRFARYHMLALNFRGKGVLRDHAELRDLVIERRADEAVDLLTRHIRSGVDHIKSCGGFG